MIYPARGDEDFTTNLLIQTPIHEIEVLIP